MFSLALTLPVSFYLTPILTSLPPVLKGLTFVGSGLWGINTASTLYDKEGRQMSFDLQKKFYKGVDVFLESKLKSPGVYLPYIEQIEKNQKSTYDLIVKRYSDEYRQALDKCRSEDKDLDCHSKWYQFL